MMTFEQFFKVATGYAPYDYQRRLAVGESLPPWRSLRPSLARLLPLQGGQSPSTTASKSPREKRRIL